MSSKEYQITGMVERKQMVEEIRKASRQFAMLYFHFCSTIYSLYGLEKTKDIVRKTVYELGVDRSNQLREKAIKQGKNTDTVEDFMSVIDVPLCGWIPEWGANHCPYAEVWRSYCEEHPWFKELAPFYCDVIDTTTIENFTKRLSHEITQNVILEGETCERRYFESEQVKGGQFTYGEE